MKMEINGTNIMPFIAHNGLKWQRSDIDGPAAGRLQNGEMLRDRVATKIRWDVSCRPLSPLELSSILTLIKPEYVSLKYTDPETGRDTEGFFYSNNFPVSLYGSTVDGHEIWQGLTFPLIQK